MQIIKKAVLSLAAIGMIGGVAAAIAPQAVFACSAGQVKDGKGTCQNCSGISCVSGGAGEVQTGGGNSSDLPTFFGTLTNMILFVLGAIAVIMIVIGGVKYTTSNGDSNSIKSAKDTILYSVIGLVVAIMAYAIVHWVISKL